MALQFPRCYFALNHAFAARAAELTGCTLADVYLKYTQLYLAFGLERTLDPCVPAWEAFVQGIGRAGDRVEWND